MTNEANAGDAAEASRMADTDNADAAAAPPPTAKAGADKSGLASVPQIVELADGLSACADQLHERIMRDIRAYDGGPVPAKVQATARALLEDELILRQRANGLYADAATFIVKSLGKSQQGIVALTSEAAEKIRKIALVGDVTGLVGGLLLLAGSVTTGQPAGIITALDKINTQLKAIKSHRAPAAKKPS
ncbi:hypothetical protein [Massilia niabensis]|uniref:Uncharacterized protein n=1 Tax=Massilia niabensis TaxID=544910 RepID=A0ABW0L316_9BURK